MRTQGDRAKIAGLALLPLALLGLIVGFGRASHTLPAVPLSTALRLAQHHAISSAVVSPDGSILFTTRDGLSYITHKESGEVVTPALMAGGAEVSINSDPGMSLGSALETGGTILLVCIVLYSLRGLQGGSKMRVASATTVTEQAVSIPVSFNDVAGVDEAKSELSEIVEFLSSPERYKRIGAHIPKGVLLSGAPGTGKTLLARAVAGEAGVPFFSISGSAFVEMYVGIGAARVRDLFAKARKAAPAIIFIDELDAVGGKRSTNSRGGNDEREHTLNQLLVEMDGFKGDSGVVVIAATNRPDMLDAALLRPGRFDRRVTMSTPDRAGRRAVLALHAANVRVHDGVDFDVIAGQTSGMSPAELANVVNEAALLAARERHEEVGKQFFESALLRVLAGPEMKSRVMSPELKRVIAYHEVGHALVMKLLPNCDPVTKVQAIARGNALGITVSMPKEDQYLMTRSALSDRIVGIMGGRAAEELFFNEVTTGAQQDIQQANAIARRMVTEFGMSSLGHISIAEGEYFSPELASKVDEATRVMVEDAYASAKLLVTSRRAALRAAADHLFDVETIDGDELDGWLERFPAEPDLHVVA